MDDVDRLMTLNAAIDFALDVIVDLEWLRAWREGDLKAMKDLETAHRNTIRTKSKGGNWKRIPFFR